jgi:hypothetical protein
MAHIVRRVGERVPTITTTSAPNQTTSTAEPPADACQGLYLSIALDISGSHWLS